MTDLRTSTAIPAVRPAVAAMQAYKPIHPLHVLSDQLGIPVEDLMKLDANENPYGPPPAAIAVLEKLDQVIPIYPDPEARRLRQKLADYLGVDMRYILAGAGADELIDLMFRLFIDPDDVIIDCPPTFGMYSFGASLAGAQMINVPRTSDFRLNIEAVEQAVLQHQPKLIFVTAPNNPDGDTLPEAVLERLLALSVMVVLDEAYHEFSGTRSAVSMVPNRRNLVVLRTFSKWAGLAGLRVGYGVFPESIIDHLWKIKQPYNVSVAAEAAACAALDDHLILQQRAELIVQERERLMTLFEDISFLEPYPSRANFILCRITGRDAGEFKRRLAEDYGILVRHFNKPGLYDHVRITVGKPEHSDRLIEALRRLDRSDSV